MAGMIWFKSDEKMKTSYHYSNKKKYIVVAALNTHSAFIIMDRFFISDSMV